MVIFFLLIFYVSKCLCEIVFVGIYTVFPQNLANLKHDHANKLTISNSNTNIKLLHYANTKVSKYCNILILQYSHIDISICKNNDLNKLKNIYDL